MLLSLQVVLVPTAIVVMDRLPPPHHLYPNKISAVHLLIILICVATPRHHRNHRSLPRTLWATDPSLHGATQAENENAWWTFLASSTNSINWAPPYCFTVTFLNCPTRLKPFVSSCTRTPVNSGHWWDFLTCPPVETILSHWFVSLTLKIYHYCCFVHQSLTVSFFFLSLSLSPV